MDDDKFSQSIKNKLAHRAGYCCSYPECDFSTAGPSEEADDATANTGEAAHIAGAKPSSRRYDGLMTSEQRSAFDNGIWCCRTHAKKIDTDETTYTVPMLKHWKLLAERRANLRASIGNIPVSNRREMVELGLAPDSILLKSKDEHNKKIGEAVSYAYIADIYGSDISHSVRDFLIEFTRNAFDHGLASEVEIKFNHNAITITDNGAKFALSTLNGPNSRGGGLAFNELKRFKQLGVISSRRLDDHNQTYIPFVLSARDLPNSNPCALRLDPSLSSDDLTLLNIIQSCDYLFLIAPDYSVYSDIHDYKDIIKGFMNAFKVVLILPNASLPVINYYKNEIPYIEIQTWEKIT